MLVLLPQDLVLILLFDLQVVKNNYLDLYQVIVRASIKISLFILLLVVPHSVILVHQLPQQVDFSLDGIGFSFAGSKGV